MELKSYQENVLTELELYLKILSQKKQDQFDYYNFQKKNKKKSLHPNESQYCSDAWEEIKSRIPVKTRQYNNRIDGINFQIPNLCFKVPTAGGKTLLAVNSVRTINHDFFKKSHGFVLWLVPSESIYSQTIKNFKNKEHEYRKVFDRISGGKTIILEKNDKFTKEQVESNLCVMMLMLQSGNRKTKEFLKIFRDSGSYKTFFPEEDDYETNKKLLDKVKNLDLGDLTNFKTINSINGLNIKHSIGNVLKLIRPIIIIDEGHRAKTNLASETINNFNPSFILELSATPGPLSNILSETSGISLKKEHMIKLPINLSTTKKSNWKDTLTDAVKKNDDLDRIAKKLFEKDGTYIRPILLIKAEVKKKNNKYDQVEDIKKYLINNLQIDEKKIKLKLSGINELNNIELLSKFSKVQYIITKDALKEGWDCPFAYTLAILSKTKNKNALTQFTGRILRQPNARETSIKELNECYIFCNEIEVNEAIQGIKKGLENEGFQDVIGEINIEGNKNDKKKIKQKKDVGLVDSLVLPILTVQDNKKIRKFDYDQDILPLINWEEYSFKKLEEIQIKSSSFENTFSIIDINKDDSKQLSIDFFDNEFSKNGENKNLDLSLMTTQLMDKINNPWQAYRIINETIEKLKKRGIDKNLIQENSTLIISIIKNDCYEWFLNKSENIFKEKIDRGIINFKLFEDKKNKFLWKLLDEIEIYKNTNENPIELKKNIYKPQFRSNYNEYEYAVATYMNSNKAVKWWHRLSISETQYSITGWKKNKVYPDFLLKLVKTKKNESKLYFIETKGDFLDNEDTQYKKKLFKYINEILKDNKSKSNNSIINKNELSEFKIIFEKNWQNEIQKLF